MRVSLKSRYRCARARSASAFTSSIKSAQASWRRAFSACSGSSLARRHASSPSPQLNHSAGGRCGRSHWSRRFSRSALSAAKCVVPHPEISSTSVSPGWRPGSDFEYENLELARFSPGRFWLRKFGTGGLFSPGQRQSNARADVAAAQRPRPLDVLGAQPHLSAQHARGGASAWLRL